MLLLLLFLLLFNPFTFFTLWLCFEPPGKLPLLEPEEATQLDQGRDQAAWCLVRSEQLFAARLGGKPMDSGLRYLEWDQLNTVYILAFILLTRKLCGL